VSYSNCAPSPGLFLTPCAPSSLPWSVTGVTVCFISIHCGKRKTLRACLGLDGVVFIQGTPPFSYGYSLGRPVFLLLLLNFYVLIGPLFRPVHSSQRLSCFLLSEGSVIVCVYSCRLTLVPYTTIYLILSWSHGLEELRYPWLRDCTDKLCDRLTVLEGYDRRKCPDPVLHCQLSLFVGVNGDQIK